MSSLLRACALCSRALVVLALVALLVAPASTAQISNAGIPMLSPSLGGLDSRMLQSVDSGTLTLEGPIDPATYLVGPGDMFSMAIGGQVPLTIRARVSADGTLVIPDVGSFRVAERPLSEVLVDLRAGIRRIYRNVEADIVLSEPRQFYIHVSGAVLEPGRHVVMPIARVEDALVAAMGGVSPQLVLGLPEARRSLSLRAIQSQNPSAIEAESIQPIETLIAESAYRPAFRNVLVTHQDGTSARVDLLRYYATGNPETNPYLRDGDSIFLPFYDPTTGSVSVEGAVPEPGLYDHRPDDTVLALLRVALGPDASSHTGDVRLIRADPAAAERTRLLDASEWGSTPLYPGDRLLVLNETEAFGVATLEGALRYPGRYPVRSGETTLREVIDLAGGLTPDALVRGAFLERKAAAGTAGSRSDSDRLAFNFLLEPETREAAIGERLYEYARRSGLDYSGRLYITRELLAPLRVSVDVEAVLQGNAPDVLLRDGDRLVVPTDLRSVAVLGQVTRPGYVPFEPGRTAEHYIAAAGGRTIGATNAFVVDASTGAFTEAGNAASLLSGDIVFVDRIPMGDDRISQQVVAQERSLGVSERREEADRRFRTLSTVLSAIGTTATVVTTVVTVILAMRE